MLNEAYATTIGKLTLRGPANAQARLQRELQSANWPEAPGEQVVFVRQLKVSNPRDHLCSTLLEEARHCVYDSQDPDNVVRFANTRDMLAALLSDLARGIANQRWYWQRWQHLMALPTSRALYSILADHLPQINALVERLHLQHTLASVWNNLTETDAEQLCRELYWHNGVINIPTDESGNDSAFDLFVPLSAQQRWQTALRGLPAQSDRLRLIALLMAQEHCPISLIHSPNSTIAAVSKLLRKRSQQVVSGAANKPAIDAANNNIQITRQTVSPTAEVKPSIDSTTPSRAVNQNNLGPATETQATTNTATQSASDLLQPEEKLSASVTDATPSTTSTKATAETTSRPVVKHSQHIHPAHLVTIETQPNYSGHEFHTQQGGVFYLLNFLNRPAMQSIMGDYWQQLPNGWIWLYRVAQRLHLDSQDPVCFFLAQQLGYERPDALQSLPDLPEPERITALAQQWYGAANLWQPSLLMLPAHIRYSPSHVDMHVPVASVQLNIRLAGLDINPGWLPWLGRVVQFHFDQAGDSHHE